MAVFCWVDFIIDERYKIRDLWKHKDLGSVKEGIGETILGHGVLLLKFDQ